MTLRRLLLSLALLAATAGPARAADAAADGDPDQYAAALRLLAEGRQREAEAALKRVIASTPQHAGARLDLAIVQCALGRADEAEALFREIEARFDVSGFIHDLIAAHRLHGCRAWEPKSLRTLSVSRGHDTNVNQGASNPFILMGSGANLTLRQLTDDYLPKSDNFTLLSFDYARELSRSGAIAIAQLRARRNDQLHEHDTNALLLGVEQPWDLGRWALRGAANASVITLGGEPYQKQGQLQLFATPAGLLPKPFELTLGAAVGRITYPHRTHFDASSGELNGALLYRGERVQVQAGFGWLADHGEPERLGGNRHGRYVTLQAQGRLSEKLTVDASVVRQDWRGQTVYAPGQLDAVRRQSTRQWRLGVSTPLGPRHTLQLELRDIKNNENLSLFQYNGRSIQLNWRWGGF